MLHHRVNTWGSVGGGVTVLERMKWEEEEELVCGGVHNSDEDLMMVADVAAISTTFSCPPALPDSSNGFKKRKPKPHNPKFAAQDDNKHKRIKVRGDDGESKITTTANTNNADSSNSKADYIHVRARRGQATDSHSLAERVRREKISERMKYLQDLVPGCNKITGKAGMLDEIINYVRSLQRQVEFLSMKLATVNSRLDLDVDDVFDKEEMLLACAATFPTVGMSSDINNPSCHLQLNSPHQIDSYGGLDTGLRRTISAPVSVSMPETFLDSSCFTQIPTSSTLETDFQNLYNFDFDQASPTPFPSQLFTFHRSD